MTKHRHPKNNGKTREKKMDNRVLKHSRKELQRIKDRAKELEELEKTEPRPGEKS